MIIEGMSIDAGEVVEADLCIVGAGPAGLTLAREFIGTNHRVYVLETGDERVDERTRSLADGDVVGHPYFPLSESRGFAVGGSSHLWEEWMRGRRLDPIDFQSRSWVPDSGWPFGSEELAPFYERGERLLGLTGSGVDTPESLYSDEVRPAVFRYSNTFDFEAMRREIEVSANVCLVVNSTVVDLETDPDSARVDRAVASAGTPHRFSVAARIFALAAGGIETPRLLLAANGGRGLANSSGVVGRYFMEHPTMRSGVVVPADLNGFPVPYFRFASSGSSHVKGSLTPTEAAMERQAMLNCMVLLTELDDVVTSEGVRSLAIVKASLQGVDDAGESVIGHFINAVSRPWDMWRYAVSGRLREPRRRLRLSVTAEQAPDKASRVVLGDRRDAFGLPLPVLDWQIGDLERHTVRSMQESIDRLFRERGWGHVKTMLGDERPPRVFRGEWHHLGTTRMASSPRKGAVNATGRSHDLANLYIAGGSTFPTVGYANPTLTIVALSLRMARQLDKALSRQASLGPIW